MSFEESLKIIQSQPGLTLNNNLIKQNFHQNFINAKQLFGSKDNELHTLHSSQNVTDNFELFRKPIGAYTQSLFDVIPNKVNLKLNTLSSFSPIQHTQHVTATPHSDLATALNNPYLYNETILSQNEFNSSSTHFAHKENENTGFLPILNDMKQLYTSPSLSKQVNENRSEKLNLLSNYFANSEHDMKLDDKDHLIYKTLKTNTKFATYVDAFIKRNEKNSQKLLPIYFKEIFVDKILKSQDSRFNPSISLDASNNRLTKEIELAKKAKRKNKHRSTKHIKKKEQKY